MRIAVFLQEDETEATKDETHGLGPCGPHLEGVRSAHTSDPQQKIKRSQQVSCSLLIILPSQAEDGSSRYGWQKGTCSQKQSEQFSWQSTTDGKMCLCCCCTGWPDGPSVKCPHGRGREGFLSAVSKSGLQSFERNLGRYFCTVDEQNSPFCEAPNPDPPHAMEFGNKQ